MLKKLYRPPGPLLWTILEKEVVDEIIFRTVKPRNRLILELMVRGGMRIGEILKLTPNDIEDRKLTRRAPKSGKEREIVFIPQKIGDRLKECITKKGIGPDQRIFPRLRNGKRGEELKTSPLSQATSNNIIIKP